MKPTCTFIIVTYNQPQLLQACVTSFGLATFYPQKDLYEILIVNNGPKENLNFLSDFKSPWIRTLQSASNVGWEGGLKLGLANTEAPFVCFCNDDIRLISGQKDWFWKLMAMFNDPTVGAVGPASNFVMGHQNIMVDAVDNRLETPYLIGFFLLLRREALEKAGGVDDTLPGGDDIDLSIRLKDQGYRLICRRDVFVYHHGAVTGGSVYGDYWNSIKMQEKTDIALIRKHGMKKVFETMFSSVGKIKPYTPQWLVAEDKDTEGDECRKYVSGDKVLELGCGGRKTVPHAVGLDFNPSGRIIPFVTSNAETSVTDVVCDVSIDLPVPEASQDSVIARHILEHCQDPLATLAAWNRALKIGGKLIVAIPNQELGNTILHNPEHVVSFTPDSLGNFARMCGFREISCVRNVNGTSCVSIFEKIDSAPIWLQAKPTPAPLAARFMQLETVCQ